MWPRQEWIFDTFHSGGDGYEPTLLGTAEPLRGLPPTNDVFVSDGQNFIKHDTWNSSSFTADVIANAQGIARLDLNFAFTRGANVSFVRVYPYYIRDGGPPSEDPRTQFPHYLQGSRSIDIDPETHWYGSCYEYLIQVRTKNDGVWHNLTGEHTNRDQAIPYRVTRLDIEKNSSADLMFFDHRAPRGEVLPESLETPRTTRTFANGSWWFDLPLLEFDEMRVSLYSSVVTPGDVIRLGLSEIEVYERTEQYVPGAMVMSIAAKSEDIDLMQSLNSQCCRAAIRCPPGSYCLAGAAHGSVFTTDQALAFAATGGKDFEAPQMGIAGNWYSDGTDNPLGTGQCPKGNYCPGGSSVPRPCWRGHSCSGAGVVKPTVCPTGTFGNVGVPAYTYGWEMVWPLSKPAELKMGDDLSLMYYDAMREVDQTNKFLA